MISPLHDSSGRTRILLLTLNLFLLLMAYYILKTVRESLILTQGGAEIKSYSAAAQSIVLILVVPLYDAIAARLNRACLITFVTFLFAITLILFFVLDRAGYRIGLAFFIWLGIFSVTLVTQFWALASDLYSEQQGRRTFPILGIGAALGALAGAGLSARIFELLGIGHIMLLAAGLLLISIALTHAIDRQARHQCPTQAELSVQAIDGPGGFALVFANRPLLLIAGLIVLTNIVNTTGEFLLSKMAVDSAAATLGACAGSSALREQFIGRFYASYFCWGGLAGVVLQIAFVCPALRRLGIQRSLLVLPGIALLGYGALAVVPALGIARITKIFENSLDYTLQKTAVNALFLSTSRAAKYKAKTVIDTFFYRAGDLLQALLVGAGSYLALTVRHYAVINVACTVVWVTVIFALIRQGASEKAGVAVGR